MKNEFIGTIVILALVIVITALWALAFYGSYSLYKG